MSGFILTRRLPATVLRLSPQMSRTFTSSTRLSTVLDSNTISKITEKEKEITGKEGPVKGGPTAQAQKHVGEQLNSNNLSDITKGETKITGESGARQGGPTNAAQSMATGSNASTSPSPPAQSTTGEQHTGKLDASTISKVTDAEKSITNQDGPVQGGPTAQAQKHVGENISSEALHDITEGEKKITGGERVKGGPTSTAQSELAKSRSQGGK